MSASRPRPYTVALTGGVAAGKSTVARRFAALGVPVVDADAAARAVVQPGQPALAEIAAMFGSESIAADGGLDRAWMRQRVFADVGQRRRLEAIVHPRVRAWIEDRLDAVRAPYALLDIPLLAETWPAYAWVDRVLLVDAPPALRRARLMQRDRIDATDAQRLLDAQATDATRRQRADDVLDNSGGEQALEAAVAALHAHYRLLSAAAER
jgi:dephospho-CoA kinase